MAEDKKSTTDAKYSNGNKVRIIVGVIQIVTIIMVVTLAYGKLANTSEFHIEYSKETMLQLQKEIEKKVDQKQYDECIRNMEKTYLDIKDDMGEIRKQQTRMMDKIDNLKYPPSE